MRGEVEIWSGDELVLREPNMIVDGAGELLADIMTLSPSLSGIANTSTSAILDASNYTIQAISFGTGKDAYNENAHANNVSKESLAGYLATIVATSGVMPVVSFISSINSPNTPYPYPLNYVPVAGLPVAPDPTLKVLEPNIEMSATVGGISVSSVFPPNGQLTNFLPSSIYKQMVIGTPFSNNTSAVLVASLMGCFPDGSGTMSNPRLGQRYFLRRTSNTSVIPEDTQYAGLSTSAGLFNAASSMDVSGFVNMIMSSVPRPGYLMSSVASGLCLSANGSFSSNGIVEYSVALGAGDLAYANFYGGIYHLGLWTIDMQKSIEAGNNPPFRFSVLNNPRKYKLFCRKGLSKNLGFIEPFGGNTGEDKYKDLTIKWRLRFL
jgi:hypothetical protein